MLINWELQTIHLVKHSQSTSVGHGRLNDVQCGVVFTQVVGHVPIRVDRQQIRTAAGDEQIND